MTDQQLLERRVRETLTTRADGVAATPELYERVQRGIRRDRRWGLARAWAMLATIVVLAGLVIVALPSDEVGVDVVDEPSKTTRDDGDGTIEDVDGGVDTAPVSDLPFGGVGYAQLDAGGRLTVYAPDGSSRFSAATVRIDAEETRTIVPAVDLAVPADWTSEDGVLVALVEVADGGHELHTHRMGEDGIARAEAELAGPPDGDRIAVLPDGSAAVWVEDLDLVVMPIAPGRGTSPRATSLDLPPNGPASLVAQQVVAHDDGGLSLLATDPEALQAWSIPLRPGDVPGMYDPDFVPAPMPGFGDVLDVVSLPDGSMLSLEAPAEGGDVPFLRRTTFFGPQDEDQLQPLDDLLWPNDGGFELDTGGGWQVTLHDGERGIVHRFHIDPDAAGEEPLATSRGADAAIAGVHVGADPTAWDMTGGSGEALRGEELEALLEEQARVRAIVQEARASIAALEERRDRAAADEAEAMQEQLAEQRAALAREQAELDAIAQEIAALRAEAARREAEADSDG